MSWTYSGDPGKSDRDLIRFKIGDTNKDDPQLSNEEIKYLVETHGVGLAPYQAVKKLFSKYSRLIDESVGGVKYSYSQRLDHYTELMAQLKYDSDIIASPVIGGLSISGKESVEEDDDRVKPKFTKDTHEFEQVDPKTGRIT